MLCKTERTCLKTLDQYFAIDEVSCICNSQNFAAAHDDAAADVGLSVYADLHPW